MKKVVCVFLIGLSVFAECFLLGSPAVAGNDLPAIDDRSADAGHVSFSAITWFELKANHLMSADALAMALVQPPKISSLSS